MIRKSLKGLIVDSPLMIISGCICMEIGTISPKATECIVLHEGDLLLLGNLDPIALFLILSLGFVSILCGTANIITYSIVLVRSFSNASKHKKG